MKMWDDREQLNYKKNLKSLCQKKKNVGRRVKKKSFYIILTRLKGSYEIIA